MGYEIGEHGESGIDKEETEEVGHCYTKHVIALRLPSRCTICLVIQECMPVGR